MTITAPPIQVPGHERDPGEPFSGGEIAIFPSPAYDLWFPWDIPDGQELFRALLTDRGEPPATPTLHYVSEWSTSAMDATVLVRWSGPAPMQLHIAAGRLPRSNHSGALAQRQDFNIVVPFPAGVVGRITVPVPAGDGLPAVIVSTRDGFNETGGRLYYAGTEFHRAEGTFQMNIIAMPGWQTFEHVTPARCTSASLAQWYAADARPNTFMYLTGHNDEGGALPPAGYEQIVRELIARDLTAAVSPEVGLQASELRWLLIGPWKNLQLMDDYADALHRIAADPPPGLEVGQIGVVSLYDKFGGVNPIGQLHFNTEAEADLMLGAVWEEIQLACPTCGCYSDCNADSVLNLSDFGCFTTKFALADPYADCNGDGVRNLSDFGCFQTKFALGCP